MRVWNKRGLFERPVFPPQEFFQMFRRRLRIPWDGKSQVLPSFPLGRVFGASEGVLKFADFLHGWRPRVFSRGGGADEEPTCRSIEAHLRWLGKGIPVAAMPTSCDLPSDADQLQSRGPRPPAASCCDLPSDADQLQYTITRIDCVLSCDLPSDADQLQYRCCARTVAMVVTCPQTRISYNLSATHAASCIVVTCPQTRISYNSPVALGGAFAGCDLPSDADQLQSIRRKNDTEMCCDLPSDADQLQSGLRTGRCTRVVTCPQTRISYNSRRRNL